jgi:hypothetical protein
MYIPAETSIAINNLPPLPRFKIKFSPDKVDTMVIQAIALLDDLDKEVNIYAMRVKVCALFLGALLQKLIVFF